MPRAIRPHPLASAIALLAINAAAHAQNALGNGSLQGANETIQTNQRLLQTPGAVFYPQNRPRVARPPNYNQDLAFRNAIVTGNIGGGLNFRGELGYAGTFDFRGELGSDDIFDFQRRSIPASNASLLGQTPIASNISPAQQSLGYTVAGQQTALGGSPIIRRPGSGFTSAQVLGEDRNTLPEVDIYGRVQGGLRAPSAYQQRADSIPTIVGTGESEDGQTLAIVSNDLLGVKPFNLEGYRYSNITRDMRARELGIPDSLIDAMRARREAREAELLPNADQPGAEQLSDPLSTPATDPATQPIRALPTTAEPYKRIIEQLQLRNPELPEPAPPVRPQTPPATDPLAQPDDDDNAAPKSPLDQDPIDPYAPLNARLDDLRRALEPDTADRKPKRRDPAQVPTLDLPDPTQPRKPDASPPLEPVEGLDPVNEARKLLGLEPITVVRLTDPDTLSTLFDEHVAVGEALLREGRYFDAEERFTAALLLEPGDPLASAGRVLAQISAGMYLSGELNLRAMLAAYPELAIVDFDERLLPDPDRRERILGQLQERAKGQSQSARAAGLLLAYMGRQLDNRDDIETGFEAIDRVNKRLGVGEDKLADALRALWLAEDAPPDE